jgi:hypothetical protein
MGFYIKFVWPADLHMDNTVMARRPFVAAERDVRQSPACKDSKI